MLLQLACIPQHNMRCLGPAHQQGPRRRISLLLQNSITPSMRQQVMYLPMIAPVPVIMLTNVTYLSLYALDRPMLTSLLLPAD